MIEAKSGQVGDLINKGIVLVDIHGVWCAPCKAMSPILEVIQKKYEGRVTIVKLDVDECNTEAKQLMGPHGIRSVPAFFFFKDGQEKSHLVGKQTEDQLVTVLNDLLKDSCEN
jgi:thioredoxin 1